MTSTHENTTTTPSSIPATSATQYRSWGGELFNPRYENQPYDLNDIIPLVVPNVLISPDPSTQQPQPKKPSRLINLFKDGNLHQEKGDGKTTTKTIFLPRSEYLKWFATDEKGVYIGSEEKREWTEEELDEKFGRYRPVKNKAGRGGLLDRMLVADARGL